MTQDRHNDVTITEVDVVVVGGGSAGSTAAIYAQQALPRGRLLLLEKANVKRSGAIAMDGLNNAVIPGHATPEQYVKEITMANDGIVNQKALLAYAENSYSMIEDLDRWGVKFQKNETGEFDVKKVHHNGNYVLPMPEGYDLKRILYRKIKQSGVRVVNRVMATRLLVERGRVVGVLGFDTRDGHFEVIRAKSVILCCGASGRLGLPASGYLYGTYENPSNAGDGYSLSYHAGAELTGIECFQINPLIKDYNGPACAYVTGPFGGHTVNAHGHRFIESDYWSGYMMLEFYKELHSENGPVYLKLDHLAPETLLELERVLHRTERPSRGRFHEGRGQGYATDRVEMHISEIGLCSGHSASGVWVNEHGETTLPGLYTAGDMACVPHNYLLGALTYGKICAERALRYNEEVSLGELSGEQSDQIEAEKLRIFAPLSRPNGVPHHQYEYKVRRLVNDYLQQVGLADFLKHYPNQLSGGMQQRVSLARVLVNRPRVLLMDEPFCSLDAQTRLEMQEMLLDLWQEFHMTVVFVSHDVDEAIFLSDRVLVSSRRPGRIKGALSVELPRPRDTELLTSPEFMRLKRQALELLGATAHGPAQRANGSPRAVNGVRSPADATQLAL